MCRLFLLLLVALLCGQAFSQNTPTADEIIAKNIQARGGLNKLTGIKTIRYTYATEEDGKPVRLVELHKRPDKLRRNISSGKNSVILAYDGQTAWQYFSSQGKSPSPAPSDFAQELKEEADIDGSLVNYKEKGSTVQLEGKEKLNGKDVYNLKLTLKEGQTRNIYIDARNFLEVKETGSFQNGGKKVDFVILSKDYRPIQGIMFPFVIDQKSGDEENQITRLQKVELNVPIADSVFSMAAVPSQTPKAHK